MKELVFNGLYSLIIVLGMFVIEATTAMFCSLSDTLHTWGFAAAWTVMAVALLMACPFIIYAKNITRKASEE